MKINENSIEEFEELPHEEFIKKNFLKFIKTVKKEEILEDCALFLMMSFWFAKFMSKKRQIRILQTQNRSHLPTRKIQ